MINILFEKLDLVVWWVCVCRFFFIIFNLNLENRIPTQHMWKKKSGVFKNILNNRRVPCRLSKITNCTALVYASLYSLYSKHSNFRFLFFSLNAEQKTKRRGAAYTYRGYIIEYILIYVTAIVRAIGTDVGCIRAYLDMLILCAQWIYSLACFPHWVVFFFSIHDLTNNEYIWSEPIYILLRQKVLQSYKMITVTFSNIFQLSQFGIHHFHFL